jgi:hypothetical protein
VVLHSATELLQETRKYLISLMVFTGSPSHLVHSIPVLQSQDEAARIHEVLLYTGARVHPNGWQALCPLLFLLLALVYTVDKALSICYPVYERLMPN